ncbi:MAG: hypothetical protein NC238_16170 [Dehalobacter sp.]|nr:hypothetical protein [Dehalobacter sp.]
MFLAGGLCGVAVDLDHLIPYEYRIRLYWHYSIRTIDFLVFKSGRPLHPVMLIICLGILALAGGWIIGMVLRKRLKK